MGHTSMTATRGHIVCTILDLSVRIATPRERSRTRIAPLGHSAVARRARLLAKSGYFITVAQNTGISPKITGIVSGIATGGGLRS